MGHSDDNIHTVLTDPCRVVIAESVSSGVSPRDCARILGEDTGQHQVLIAATHNRR